MGKYSKNDNSSDFFENLKIDIEKERLKHNPSLADFTKQDDDFLTGTFKIDFEPTNSVSDPLLSIKNKVQKIDDKELPPKESNDIPVTKNTDTESLLEKCKQYTHDEDGNDYSIDNSPIYELKSIAEILKSDSIDALNNLSEKYHIKITDETKRPDKTKINDKPLEVEVDNETQNDNKTEPSFIDMIKETKEPEKSDDQIFEDYILQTNPDTVIDNLNNIPDISDIDASQKITENTKTDSENVTTIKFIPVKDNKTSTQKITISNITGSFKQIKQNDKSDNTEANKPKLENNEFEDFQSNNEIKESSELKSFIIKYSKQKRNNFFKLLFAFVCLLFVIINRIPTIFDSDITNSKASTLMFSVVTIIEFLLNIDCVRNFKNIFNKLANPDTALFFTLISVIATFSVQIFKNDFDLITESYYLVLTLSFISFMRVLFSFRNVSIKLSNLKLASSKFNKNAVTFIDDTSVTFAMAKNSIEGDVLISGSRKVDFIEDFNKYFDYSLIQNGNYCYFQFVWVIVSIISAVIGTLYFESLISGLFLMSLLFCVLSLPIVFYINTLPIYSANKKLNPLGAMINGIEGASQIETSNATVISSSELFPEGSVILKDLKILSENSFDDTILRAASLTESVGSTLAPVFRKIAKTNSAYVLPDSDTVKYEERLGLSGWVDNELLFIGNRTLLESHGIEVPSIEIDKQILKRGCFPVYLATVQKACALLIIQYEPFSQISKDLRKVCNLGVTVLIKNNDPNINEQMIADYFGVYEDTLKIISNSGIHMYNKATSQIASCKAPALFKNNNLAMLKIVSFAASVKKSNSLLTLFYTVFSILVATGFIYTTFSQRNSIPSFLLLFVIELSITVITTIFYLFKKP